MILHPRKGLLKRRKRQSRNKKVLRSTCSPFPPPRHNHQLAPEPSPSYQFLPSQAGCSNADAQRPTASQTPTISFIHYQIEGLTSHRGSQSVVDPSPPLPIANRPRLRGSPTPAYTTTGRLNEVPISNQLPLLMRSSTGRARRKRALAAIIRIPPQSMFSTQITLPSDPRHPSPSSAPALAHANTSRTQPTK